MRSEDVQYIHGLREQHRQAAAEIYDEAFGEKFAVAVPSPERRVRLLAESLQLKYSIGAVCRDKLLGIAGYQSVAGSLTGGMSYRQLLSHLGVLRGNWAAAIFSLYERKLSPGEMLMGGIAVDPVARGQGIGTQLLNELCGFATEQGLRRIRLDVIDTNDEARRLYQRNGFRVVKTEKFEWLRWLLGFGGAVTMRKRLPRPHISRPSTSILRRRS